MAENRVEANAHNAGSCPASNAIHGHINDFLVRTGLRSGVSELQLPCFTAVRAEIALMSGGAFAVTHHAFSSGAGRTSDGNGSHASTLKSPSYTKSVNWQHHLNRRKLNFPCKTNGDYQACLCRSVRVKGLSSGPNAVAICPSRD
ncbi:putative minor fimbrial subunit [Escherichia coli]|nr:putative minor fimbrial subunit [Escherichia coli]